LTAASDTMSRQQTSTGAVHIIKFTSTSGLGTSGTITIVFPSGFTTTTLGPSDLQICHGAFGTATITGGTACSGSTESISSSASGTLQWGATITGSGPTTIVLTAPPSMANTIPAAQQVTVEIAAAHLINPSSASTPNITVATSTDTLGDNFNVPIITNDQIGVTAAVTESVTFSINVGIANSGGINPIAIGTLAPTTVWYSSNSGSNYGIWLNLATNTASGAVVTVQSTNGSLKSTSTTDNIPSITQAMAAGTADYGLCDVLVSGTPALTKVGNFANTCTNSVGAVTTSAQPIINTNSLPVSNGVAEVVVNAEDSYLTPAHSDYGDTLTFIATGTY